MGPDLAIGVGSDLLAHACSFSPGTLVARLQWARSGQTERITWRAVAGLRSRKMLPSTSATNFRSRAPETHPTPARRGIHLFAAQRDFRLAGAEHLSVPDFGSRRRLTPRRELRSDRPDPFSRSSFGPTAAAFSTTCGVAVEPLALSFALRISLPIFESLGLVLPAARQRGRRGEPENAFHLWRDLRTTEVARRSVTCSAHLQRGGTS